MHRIIIPEQFIDRFNSASLPKSEWTHEAHLRMAIHYVYTHLPENILPVIRKKIKTLNDFHQTPNTDSSGYHETITVFWLNNAYNFLMNHVQQDEKKVVATFLSSKNGKKNYPLEFYSKELLFSVEARHNFVKPDLKNLNTIEANPTSCHGHLTDNEFTLSFENCELDPSLFTHEAHLRLAWIHIHKYGIEQAEQNVSNAIKKFVNHVGAQDKYHHTLTIAAVKTVYHFYQKYEAENFFDFISEYPRIQNDFKSLIDAHYSRCLLYTSPSPRDRQKSRMPSSA